MLTESFRREETKENEFVTQSTKMKKHKPWIEKRKVAEEKMMPAVMDILSVISVHVMRMRSLGFGRRSMSTDV